MKKKIYNKVVKFMGARKNGKPTFIEFGWIENPTFKNDVYILVNSAHKGGSDSFEYGYELRTDEALLYIQGLSMALNVKGERGAGFVEKDGIRLERVLKDL